MSTQPITATIFRKSVNRNSFGLRGYWCIEHAPLPGQDKLRIWEFATSEELSKGTQELPFVFSSDGTAHYPAFEIPQRKATLPVAKLNAFIKEFCHD